MDLIIPTMWKVPSFPNVVSMYADCAEVDKIIIIDNDFANRPEIPTHKVEFACFGVNIFVNPAWNEGYWRSESDLLGILNDDIEVDAQLLEVVSQREFARGEVLGFDPSPSDADFEVKNLLLDYTKPVGSQWYGFGTCMFMRKETYTVIPNLYQVWFGDDFICHGATKWGRFQSNRVRGEMSKTISSQDADSLVQTRIRQDTENAHLHLLRKSQ